MTFGQLIAAERKRKGLSQKDLAGRIEKEDGTSISPQYLNDLERDRRNPPSQHFLHQFADELGIPLDYLYYLARQLPDDVLGQTAEPDRVEAAFKAFRRALREN